MSIRHTHTQPANPEKENQNYRTRAKRLWKGRVQLYGMSSTWRTYDFVNINVSKAPDRRSKFLVQETWIVCQELKQLYTILHILVIFSARCVC